MVKPNTFIIGAQKAATSSLYYWMSQHPEICGPSSLKDHPFFLENNHSKKEIMAFQKEYYREGYNFQKIILQGYVNYMFYPEAIKNIYSFNPKAKLICVLRNPTDRAISAYNYFKKLNLERLSFKEALYKEKDRANGSQREKNNFTYKAHGLYAEQLEYIFSIFEKDQVLVLFYEDLQENPYNVLQSIFRFLEVDEQFKAELKKVNVTGEVKHKWMHNLLYNQSNIKKFFIDRFIDPILPVHKRTNLKLAFLNWNTKPKKAGSLTKNDNIKFLEEKKLLNSFFKEDIVKLEKLLNRNLENWK
ncbi:hypothetical protein C1T31_01175 [Hanstruepera neustonica]|uniref:Sulfotransferase domain-containing protein n=1 Tax=Hanstruepera neustonica TaxID=1445657 RepID=A0A2K1E3G9_9FLAO|nr:sulfotransferase [Hanstruepera neustonica]PNQ74781.1 hypothetical protein C1T31_01175 [Hanstruepera neustonica]